jgi:hypothetical protein
MQPIFIGSSSTLTIPYQTIPTCSSSEIVTPVPPPLPSHHTSLHHELQHLEIVDKEGRITQKALESWKPTPLDEEQLARLKSLNDLCAFDKITVKSCFRWFQQFYGDDFGEPFLIGGAAIWVLGWKYYCNVLASLGVPEPERFFPPTVRQKFDKIPKDYDFRVHTTTRLAVSFPQVVKDVENMIKGKLKVSTLADSPCRHLNNKINQSLNIQLPPFEFVLWHVLNANYLFGHKAIQLSCKALLHSDEETIPETPSIPLLQAILDEMLMRLNPYPNLNHQGKIRHIQAITSGYTIWSQEQWEKTAQNKFPVEKGKTIGEHLYKLIDNINVNHPHQHPAGHIFNGINTILLFGNNLSSEALRKFWESYPENNSIPAFLSPLITLWSNGNTLPSSLLTLAAFLTEAITFDSSIRSRLLYVGDQQECGYQLQWIADDSSSLSIQLQNTLHIAYEQFVLQCIKMEDTTLIDSFLDAIFAGASCQIKCLKPTGLQLRELRKRVISQLYRPEPAIKKVNFYLLAAMHAVDHLQITENALLEFLPIIKPPQSLVDVCLGSHYGAIYAQFSQSQHADPVFLWIGIFFHKINYSNACKATELIPRFQRYLTGKQYQEVMERMIKAMFDIFPEQRLFLVVNSLKRFDKLEQFHFTLFCKTVFPYLNPQYRELIYTHLQVLGETLLRLCGAKIEGVSSTTAREMVLHYLTEALLNNVDQKACRQIGEKIVSLFLFDHPLTHLIGIHLNGLKKKAFPNGITPAIPVSLTLRIKGIRSLIDRRNMESAIPETIRMVNEEAQPSMIGVIEEELVYIWSLLKGKVEQSQIPAFSQTLQLVHHEKVIEKFYYFCLDVHLTLMDKINEIHSKLKRGTLEAFLVVSLKYFFSNVPKRLSESYTKTVFLLFSCAWSPTEPFSKECSDLLKRYYPVIASQLKNDPEAQSSFLTQMYNCGLSGATLQGNMIEIVEKALQDPLTLPSDQCTHLKIAKKIYSTNHPDLQVDTLLLFGLRCLQLNQLDVALEWIQEAFHTLKNQSTPDLLVAIFEYLHQSWSYPTLAQLFLQHGNMSRITHLLTDDFLIHNIDSTLKLFEALESSDQNRQLYSGAVERFILLLEGRTNLTDAHWLSCQALATSFRLKNFTVWDLCTSRLKATVSPDVKTKAAKSYLEAIQHDCIPQGIFRIGLWMVYFRSGILPSSKFVQSLLGQKHILHTIFYNPEKEMLDSELFEFLAIAFKILVDGRSTIAPRLIADIYHDVNDRPRQPMPTTTLWALRVLFMTLMQPKVSHSLYVELHRYVDTWLKDLSAQERNQIQVINMMTQFLRIRVKKNDTSGMFGRISLDLLNTYGSEMWLTCALCYAAAISLFDHFEVIKTTTGMYLQQHPEIPKSDQEEFQIAFMRMVVGVLLRKEFVPISLFYNVSISQILGDSRNSHIQTCADTAFRIVKKEELPQGTTLFDEQMRVINLGFEIFYPFKQPYDEKVQRSIFISAIEAILHAFSIAPGNRVGDIVYYIHIMCKEQYFPSVAGTKYYDNLLRILSVLELKTTKEQSSLIYHIHYDVFAGMLVLEEKNGFQGIEDLARLIDGYCFESNPAQGRHTIEYNMREYDATVVELFKLINDLALKHPEVEFFRSHRCECMRGKHYSYEYLRRMAQSSSMRNLVMVVRFLEGNMVDRDMKHHKLFNFQQLNIISAMLENFKTGSNHQFHEVFSLLTGVIVRIRDEMAALKDTGGLNAAADVAKKMIKIITTILLKSLPQHDDDPYKPFALEFHTNMCKFIRALTLRGLFDNKAQEYWNIHKQTCDSALLFSAYKDFAFSNSIKQGLLALDPVCIQRIGESITEPSEGYRYCKKRLIDDPLERMIEMGSARLVLDTMPQYTWVKDFENHPVLDEINRRLKYAIDPFPVLI